jgi:hypothetical protein
VTLIIIIIIIIMYIYSFRFTNAIEDISCKGKCRYKFYIFAELNEEFYRF